MPFPKSIQTKLQVAIENNSPEHRDLQYENCPPFDHENPWRRSLFDYARAVLGIRELMTALQDTWKTQDWPNDQEMAIIRDVVDQWADYWEDNDYAPDEDDETLYHEFIGCIYRVHRPYDENAPGQAWKEATTRAADAFMRKIPSERAGRIIAAHGFRKASLKLLVQLIVQFAEIYGNKPFPIAQEKVAEFLRGFLGGEFPRYKVGRMIYLLEKRGVLQRVQKFIPNRRSAVFQLHDPTG